MKGWSAFLRKEQNMNELLYKKSKAVGNLNRVEGFEPLELARTISQEGQPDQLYLDVKYRKLWFRLVYPTGRIESRIVHFNENMALAEAKIYLNHTDASENYVANAYSMKFRTDDPKFGDKFLEMAETAAVGRALSDAGFGVQFADVGESNDPNQVDAGIPVPLQYQKPDPQWNDPQAGMVPPTYGAAATPPMQGMTPAQGNGNKETPFPGNQTIPSYPGAENPAYADQNMMDRFYHQAKSQGNVMGMPQNTAAPSHTASQSSPLDASLPVEELVKQMSYEQAKSVIIGGRGKYGGMSMGQVAVESPSSLDYFATNYRGHNNLIPAAARVLLNQALPLAG